MIEELSALLVKNLLIYGSKKLYWRYMKKPRERSTVLFVNLMENSITYF